MCIYIILAQGSDTPGLTPCGVKVRAVDIWLNHCWFELCAHLPSSPAKVTNQSKRSSCNL